jgi:hypothetical protein
MDVTSRASLAPAELAMLPYDEVIKIAIRLHAAYRHSNMTVTQHAQRAEQWLLRLQRLRERAVAQGQMEFDAALASLAMGAPANSANYNATLMTVGGGATWRTTAATVHTSGGMSSRNNPLHLHESNDPQLQSLAEQLRAARRTIDALAAENGELKLAVTASPTDAPAARAAHEVATLRAEVRDLQRMLRVREPVEAQALMLHNDELVAKLSKSAGDVAELRAQVLGLQRELETRPFLSSDGGSFVGPQSNAAVVTSGAAHPLPTNVGLAASVGLGPTPPLPPQLMSSSAAAPPQIAPRAEASAPRVLAATASFQTNRMSARGGTTTAATSSIGLEDLEDLEELLACATEGGTDSDEGTDELHARYSRRARMASRVGAAAMRRPAAATTVERAVQTEWHALMELKAQVQAAELRATHAEEQLASSNVTITTTRTELRQAMTQLTTIRKELAVADAERQALARADTDQRQLIALLYGRLERTKATAEAKMATPAPPSTEIGSAPAASHAVASLEKRPSTQTLGGSTLHAPRAQPQR